ncbi:MAG: hypothetical protein IID37_10495 [Planctomycetes bacterium]|nr:hypothetical protein [Planctomycetota bacterium]
MIREDHSKRRRSDDDDPMDPSIGPTPRAEAAHEELASLEAWLAEFDTPAPSESRLVEIKRRVEIEVNSQWLTAVAADPVIDEVIRARVKLAVRKRLEASPAGEFQRPVSTVGRWTQIPMMPFASAAALAFVVFGTLLGPISNHANSTSLVDRWDAGPIELAFQADAVAIASLDLELTALENTLAYDPAGPVAKRLYEELTGDIEEMADDLESIADVI